MKTHQSECEFYEPTSEVFEDGAYIINQRCQRCEVYGSQTCDRLDETFYDEGPRCEVVKRTRLDPTGLYREQDNGEWYEMISDSETIWNYYDSGNPTLDYLLENLDDTIYKEITEDGHGVEVNVTSFNHHKSVAGGSDVVNIDSEDFTGPVHIHVKYAGETYMISYDNKSVDYYD